MVSHIFETYDNYIILNGSNIYQTSSSMYIATMGSYPMSQHALQHCKYVLCFCENYLQIDIPSH